MPAHNRDAPVQSKLLSVSAVPRSFALALVALALCGLTACPSPGSDEDTLEVTETVTADGATLILGDIDVYFPAGTVVDDTEVTLRVKEQSPTPLPAGRARIVSVVEVSPHDLDLLNPIQINTPTAILSAATLAENLDAPEERIIAAHFLASDDGAQWEDAEAAFEEGRVRFKSTQAGYFTATNKVDGCLVDVTPPVCEDEWVDYGCDNVPGECPEGETIGVIENGCTACVPGPPADETCEAATAEMRSFLDRAISDSCANYCDTDDDCFAFRFESACNDGCYSLLGGIDEEPIMAFITFAQQRCGVCGEQEPSVVYVGDGVCENNQCLFPEELAVEQGETWF